MIASQVVANDGLRPVFEKIWAEYVVPAASKLSPGMAPESFVYRAQVVHPVDGSMPYVLLNEEVRLTYVFKAARDVPEGESLSIEAVGDLVTAFPSDPNCNDAFETVLLTSRGWAVWFDFSYNGGRRRECILGAEEFLRASADALLRKDLRSFAVNLYEAAERIAHAHLMLHPWPKHVRPKKHGLIKRDLNARGRLGHYDPAFVQLYNKYSEVRIDARTGGPRFALTFEVAVGDLRIAQQELLIVSARLPQQIA